MNPLLLSVSLACLLASFSAAQTRDFLFTTTLPESTLSGSGGTVLGTVWPNEIIGMEQCPTLAEKWAPRTCFHTMAGDADGDDAYQDPGMFGQIDALVAIANTAVGVVNARTIYWSPSQATGTTISGAPGLRPGDIGRIVRNGSGDGQVEHFIRMEQINQALGLPINTPIDVDAAAADPSLGVFFSLESDIIASPCNSSGGPILVRDGDVLMISAFDIVWSANLTVSSVNLGSAVVVYTEAQMDAFVANASVTDRNGVCVTQIVDTDALEIDWTNGIVGGVPGCTGVVAQYTDLIFAGESLTGGAILTTDLLGQVFNNGCTALGRPCGGGPTFGTQIGLQPPSLTQGIASSVNGLALAFVCRFVSETATPVIPQGNTVTIDFGSPGPATFVFLTIAPSGPGVVAPSFWFPLGQLCFPDFYPNPFFMGVANTATGFGSWTSPVVPFPVDLVFQGATIAPWGVLELSTPTTVEVF